jgi:hypothetical protein
MKKPHIYSDYIDCAVFSSIQRERRGYIEAIENDLPLVHWNDEFFPVACRWIDIEVLEFEVEPYFKIPPNNGNPSTNTSGGSR